MKAVENKKTGPKKHPSDANWAARAARGGLLLAYQPSALEAKEKENKGAGEMKV